MASNCEKLMIINEDFEGLHLISGPTFDGNGDKVCGNDMRRSSVSRDGNYLAFSNNTTTKVIDLRDRSTVFEQEIPGALFIGLSPKNNLFQTWFNTKNPTEDNLKIFEVKSPNALVKTFKQKQSQWKLHWTDDESLCARFIKDELHFYENNDLNGRFKKFTTQKVANFSLTTNIKKGIHYFACLSLGTHGQPNFLKLYQYPHLENHIANKSFFRTDKATFKWRSQGDALLILCAADVDKTGKSYYGEQNLNYMDINGKAFAVKLDKEGPIHAVEWHPTASEPLFCVSYGFVPPRIALIDGECRVVHSFGIMHINQIHFNRFGNLVIFAGFGNLRGGLSIYNTEKKTLISQLKSPDTTLISWAPDGVHILTAVTFPRMRVGNCLRIWHYSGKLVREITYDDGPQLSDSTWRPNQSDFPLAPKITETGIDIAQLGAQAEPARYVPPHLRNSGLTIEASSSIPSSKAPKGKGGRRGGGKGKGKGSGGGGGRDERSDTHVKQSLSTGTPTTTTVETADNGKERKIKTLEKKLEAIKKLKSVRDSGGQLEKNQLAKINKEKELLSQLKKLEITESS